MTYGRCVKWRRISLISLGIALALTLSLVSGLGVHYSMQPFFPAGLLPRLVLLPVFLHIFLQFSFLLSAQVRKSLYGQPAFPRLRGLLILLCGLLNITAFLGVPYHL